MRSKTSPNAYGEPEAQAEQEEEKEEEEQESSDTTSFHEEEVDDGNEIPVSSASTSKRGKKAPDAQGASANGTAASSLLRDVGINVIGKAIRQLPFQGMGLDAGKVYPLLEQLAVHSCAGATFRL